MARIAESVTVTTIGGAAVGLAGLLVLLRELPSEVGSALGPLAGLALAVGCVLLATTGAVVRSRGGRAALVVVGVGPLLTLLPLGGVAVGMTVIWAIAAASVVAAVEIARTGRVRAVGRWAFVVVAAWTVLDAVMSTVPLEALQPGFLAWRLDLVEPVALLVWGTAVALQEHLPAMRRRVGAIDEAWRASTAVDGTAPAPAPARDRVPLD